MSVRSPSSTTVLITGAAGFLGGHVCGYFLKRDWDVIGIDNLLTGAATNLDHLASDTRFRFLRHDVTKPFVVDDPIDLVLHFACPASPRDYLRHPIHTLKVDSVGTLHTLGIAKAHRAKYLVASTSEVYGDPQVHPQPESYWGHVNPIGPRSAYDEAKRFAEALTMAYHRAHGLDARIVRIFNTYGPRMRAGDGRVIPQFITHALSGIPLPIHGDGRQTRSFCFVDDLVDGIYRLATYDALAGAGFHPGNPEAVTLPQPAENVTSLVGSTLEIVHLPLPQDYPTRRRADTPMSNTTHRMSPTYLPHT